VTTTAQRRASSKLRRSTRRILASSLTLPVALLGAAGFSACGTSGGGGSNNSSATASPSAATSTGAGSSDPAGSGSMQAAKAAIAPYLGKPGPFGVSEPLKHVPRGAHVIYVNCGQPDCQLIYNALLPAAKALGVNLTQVVAGSTVPGIASAFNSVLQVKPSAVIDPAIDPVLWASQLRQLRAAKIPVVGIELPVDAGSGISAVIVGPRANDQVGKLQADYAYAQTGDKTDAAFVKVPEFQAFTGQANAFEAELRRLCPTCKVAITQVPAASVGSTAPSQIVSYLQKNPDTNWIALAFDAMGQGLPQALRAAGLSVRVIGAAPTPITLQYIKDGEEAASLGSSQATVAWMAMDAVARAIIGQKLGADESFGQPPREFLTRRDITFNPQAGWLPYPDYQARYKQLWGVR
jgi:ribose transport system substrate-binding protein